MVYIEDTRQQVGKHEAIARYMSENGHSMIRSKMLVGDYQRANDGSIVVDTKSGVLELMQDVFKQHVRFRNELITAQTAGIKLFVLIEEELPNKRLSDWSSPRFSYYGANRGRKVTYQSPVKLRRALETLSDRYGVTFIFCAPDRAGEYVVRLLNGESVPTGWCLTE